MYRLILVFVLVSIVGCAVDRPTDAWRDALRSCGTVIGRCGEIAW